MRRALILALTLGIVATTLGIGTAFAAQGHGTQGASAGQGAKATRGSAIAAIGTIDEAGGGSAVVDLRANDSNSKAAGALRFFDTTNGYYNGAVKSISVSNGVINASGGGGLVGPSGQRERVPYTAQITVATKQVTITVTGKDGDTYTIAGVLNPGVVRAGASSGTRRGKNS